MLTETNVFERRFLDLPLDGRFLGSQADFS